MAKKPYLDGRNRNRGLWLAFAVLAVFVIGMALLGNSFAPDSSANAVPDSSPDATAPAATN